jgi:hypothetical protein
MWRTANIDGNEFRTILREIRDKNLTEEEVSEGDEKSKKNKE